MKHSIPAGRLSVAALSLVAALVLVLSSALTGCAGKPSEKDISHKILMEYICPEKATINSLKILNTEETKNAMDKPAFRYTVTGIVEWPEGCSEFGSGLKPGTKENFQKTVYLSKTDEGVWR